MSTMSTSNDGPRQEAGGLRPWHLFLVAGLAASIAAVTMAGDTRVTNLVMLSLMAFSAVLAGAAVHRTLQPFGSEGRREESPVLSARARAELEREKMLVLRSIKELEFDRAMGKVADADFAEMVERLRARAKALIARLDAEAVGYRGLIERDLRARLAQAGAPGAAADRTGTRPSAKKPSALACSACGTNNDHDARFCKSCGAKLDAYAVSM